MRTKTEARRQDIVKAAGAVFAEMGFERASMAAIAERVGGSKATLYSYYASKEALFAAVMQEAARNEAEHADRYLGGAADLAQGLRRFGLWRLRTTLSPAGLAARQMGYAEGARGSVRELFGLTDAASTTWGRVAAALEAAMDRGELRRADPWTAAQHFRGLLEADIADRAFLEFPTPATPELMAKAVEDAVEVFLRAYTPN